MKNKLLLALLAGLLLVPKAQAYVSLMGNDPNVDVPNCPATGGAANTGYPCLGSYDYEYKDVVRTQTTGYNDAIPANYALYYSELGSDVVGLQTVSLESIYTGIDQPSVTFQACISLKAIATGYNAAFQCQTRGPALATYDLTNYTPTGIKAGTDLCIGSSSTNYGVLIPCSSGVLSKIKALEAKPAATKGTIHVLIDSE